MPESHPINALRSCEECDESFYGSGSYCSTSCRTTAELRQQTALDAAEHATAHPASCTRKYCPIHHPAPTLAEHIYFDQFGEIVHGA